LRARFKAVVAALGSEQTFCVIVADAKSIRRQPAEGFIRASAEQKVRAYDLIDRLASGLSPNAAATSQAIQAAGPDAVGLYVDELPDEPWRKLVADPILPIHVVLQSTIRPEWLEPFLARGRVSVESLTAPSMRHTG